MSTAFDPYHKWLGIPPAQQPPHHYRLLGLELFEADREVIDSAANQRMSYLHDLANGDQVKASQKLLNEVSAARRCLLNANEKATYDARLREQLQSVTAMPVDDAAAGPSTGDLFAVDVTPARLTVKRKPKPASPLRLPLYLAGGFFGCLLVLGIVFIAMQLSIRKEPEPVTEVAKKSEPPPKRVEIIKKSEPTKTKPTPMVEVPKVTPTPQPMPMPMVPVQAGGGLHFSPTRNSIGELAGIVHQDNAYHLFYQPAAGAKNEDAWGHLITEDQYRYREVPVKLNFTLPPNAMLGDVVFDPIEKQYVAFYTVENELRLAKSKDGATWDNPNPAPVLKETKGDMDAVLRVFPNPKGAGWLLCWPRDGKQRSAGMRFYTATDLTSWTFASESRIEGGDDSIEVFPLGDKLVCFAGNGKFIVGDWDGKAWKDVSEPFYMNLRYLGKTHTLSAASSPDSRCHQWTVYQNKDKASVNLLSFPHELELEKSNIDGKYRVIRRMTRVLMDETTQKAEMTKDREVPPSTLDLNPQNADNIDVDIEVEKIEGSEFTLNILGEPLRYNFANRRWHWRGDNVFGGSNGRIRIRVIVDRQAGELYFSPLSGMAGLYPVQPVDANEKLLTLTVPRDAKVKIVEMRTATLRMPMPR